MKRCRRILLVCAVAFSAAQTFAAPIAVTGVKKDSHGLTLRMDPGVLDWPYQITSGNGLLLSGYGLESVVGYGRNHDPNVGVAAAVIPWGKGEIVLLALPGLMDSFVSGNAGKLQPVTAKRLVFNALGPM